MGVSAMAPSVHARAIADRCIVPPESGGCRAYSHSDVERAGRESTPGFGLEVVDLDPPGLRSACRQCPGLGLVTGDAQGPEIVQAAAAAFDQRHGMIHVPPF